MSQIIDPIGAAPETRSVHFLTLLFGALPLMPVIPATIR